VVDDVSMQPADHERDASIGRSAEHLGSRVRDFRSSNERVSPLPVKRLREGWRLAVTWLGLSAAGSFVMLLGELAFRAPSALQVASVAYLAALAVGASLLGSVVVAIAHLPSVLWPAAGVRALLVSLLALGAGFLPRALELSGELVEGEWISRHPHVRAIRVGMVLALLLGYAVLWAWHGFGVSTVLRAGMLGVLRLPARFAWLAELVFVAFGCAVVGAVVLSLDDVLRPYLRLAGVLLFPCWLIAGTLAFRLCDQLGRHALPVACALLALLGVPSVVQVLAPDVLLGGRGAALEAKGLGNFIDERIGPRDPKLVRLDFASVGKPRCAPARQPAPLALAAGKRRNVIVLSVDTLRRDAIGKRFGKRAVAPNLEAFGRESIDYARATAPAPITLLSIGSAFTGRTLNQLWWQPRVPASVWKRMDASIGRRRVFLPPWPYFKNRNFSRVVTQGATVRLVAKKEDPAALFIEELKRARARDERGMYWLHIGNPHLPYRPPREFSFGKSVVQRYYGECAHADAILGTVLSYLRTSGYYDDSLIIMFSDHGEALGDRGSFVGHGTSMVGRMTDVPLYVRYPGVRPHVSMRPTVLTEIAPTIWHFLRRPIPRGVAACSLLDDARDANCLPPISQVYGVATASMSTVLRSPVKTRADLEARQDQLIAWRRMTPELAAISSDRRYLRDLATGVEHLYAFPDLSNEREDFVSTEPDTLRAFREQVARFRRAEAERVICQLDER
jgi:arylsulfatase A-like enzyme